MHYLSVLYYVDVYALVHVNQGKAVLSDVFVKGKSLRELAK
jgi:hypothetical protein